MKKYIIAQLTQITFWIGVTLVIAAFVVPREYIAILGIVLILIDDDIIKNWMAKVAPGLAAKIDEWTK